MTNTFAYRALIPGEEQQLCDMIVTCFNQFVAPGYSQTGNDEFLKHVTPEAIKVA
jgi:hypothetical protein